MRDSPSADVRQRYAGVDLEQRETIHPDTPTRPSPVEGEGGENKTATEESRGHGSIVRRRLRVGSFGNRTAHQAIRDGNRVMIDSDNYSIVGIHGLRNKVRRNVLEQWWERALVEGLTINRGLELRALPFSLAYWRHYLYERPLEVGPNAPENRRETDPYVEADPEDLTSYRRTVVDDLRQFVSTHLGSIIDRWKRLGIDDLDDLYIESGDYTRDLRHYFSSREVLYGSDHETLTVREALRSVLKTALLEQDAEHTLLIAHSMGSIVAYDLLCDLPEEEPDYSLEYFVTPGSPLGIPEIRQRLNSVNPGLTEPLRTPPCVTDRWVNLSDPRDTNALDAYLADDFEPNEHGVQPEDRMVNNSYVSPDGVENPHKSYGYLRTPEMSDVLAEFLPESVTSTPSTWT